MALPAFDKNGKEAGIWLSPLTDRDGRLEAIGGEGRIMGDETARFVALQNSRNGESLLAGNMGEGVRTARDNPDSGVIVRLAGDDRPSNPEAITGGRIWADPCRIHRSLIPVLTSRSRRKCWHSGLQKRRSAGKWKNRRNRLPGKSPERRRKRASQRSDKRGYRGRDSWSGA